jgi:YVTN family beta-propeller protein
MKRVLATVLAVGAIVLASCSGQALSPSTPALPNVPAASGGPVVRLVLARPQRRPGRKKKVEARIVIRIPLKRKHRRDVLTPAYISSSTKSLSVAVDGLSPTIFDLTPSSTDCHISTTRRKQRTPIARICTIEYAVTPGSHVFSLITYDETKGRGNQLSANTHVPFNVVSGSNTPLSVTLGGIVDSIEIVQPAVPQAGYSPADGFIIYGNSPVGFAIMMLDADNNVILGAGAPALSVKVPNGVPVTLATPLPNQSTYTFTSTYRSTTPTTPSAFKVTIAASPLPNTSGPSFNFKQQFSAYQPWIYVANFGDNTVRATDENGNGKTLTGSNPFGEVPSPTGIAYDPNNAWPYIPSLFDNAVCVYDVQGNFISQYSGNWENLRSPSDIAYVPVGGGRLYVVNSGYQGGYGGLRRSHSRHRVAGRMAPAPAYSSYPSPSPSPSPTPTGPSATGVTAYDEFGNLLTLSGSFPNLSVPEGIAYDSNNGRLYVTDSEDGTVLVYDTSGNFIQNFASTLPSTGYAGIAFDSQNALFYALDPSNNGVVVFDEQGNLTNVSFANLNQPTGIAYDPYDGLLYVTNSGNDTMTVYNESGTQVGPAIATGSQPWGVTAIP